MRRLLPYLGFLPLLLVAVRAFAQQEAQPGWDPVTCWGCAGDGLDAWVYMITIVGPLLGVLIGVCGLGRGRLHRMRAVPKIYYL